MESLAIKIPNPNNITIHTFCNYLIAQIRLFTADTSKIPRWLVAKWDDYFKKVFSSNSPTFLEVWTLCFSNLSYYKDVVDNSYTITLDKNVKYPGLDVTVEALVSMIHRGNREIAPSNVFEDVFLEFSERVYELYARFV